MISASQRPLTESEIEALQQASRGARLGCISNLAFYGSFLFGFPIVGGGFIGSILSAVGVSQNMAYLIGLSVAYALSVAAMVVFMLCERHIRRAAQGDLESGIAEVLGFDIRRVWEVDDLEDFGPGFLFETGDDECVYAASQQFLDFEKGKFPCTQIALERLPVSKAILKVECEGNYVASERECLSINDLRLRTECEVLSAKDLSAELSERLGIGVSGQVDE